jgi:hypothetical protein
MCPLLDVSTVLLSGKNQVFEEGFIRYFEESFFKGKEVGLEFRTME